MRRRLTAEHNELIITRQKLSCPREPFDVSQYHRVLTLQREDAHFIVLPSVTSVCVLGCLKASPTPQCLRPVFTTVECHVRVWPAALSLLQRSGESGKKSHLIGQHLPWEELGDAGVIYYTHISQGHQRKGILLTPHVSCSAFSILSHHSHMPNAHTKTYTHTQRSLIGHSVRYYSSAFGTWVSCCSVLFPVFWLLSHQALNDSFHLPLEDWAL